MTQYEDTWNDTHQERLDYLRELEQRVSELNDDHGRARYDLLFAKDHSHFMEEADAYYFASPSGVRVLITAKPLATDPLTVHRTEGFSSRDPQFFSGTAASEDEAHTLAREVVRVYREFFSTRAEEETLVRRKFKSTTPILEGPTSETL